MTNKGNAFYLGWHPSLYGRQVNDKQNVMVRKQPNDMKRSIRSPRPKVQELPTSLELDLLLPTDA